MSVGGVDGWVSEGRLGVLSLCVHLCLHVHSWHACMGGDCLVCVGVCVHVITFLCTCVRVCTCMVAFVHGLCL